MQPFIHFFFSFFVITSCVFPVRTWKYSLVEWKGGLRDVLLLLCTVGSGNKPGHELVELLLVLLVLGSNGVLGLLLHPLDKVLHVLEGIDLAGNKQISQTVTGKSFHCRISLTVFAWFVYQQRRDVASNLTFLSQLWHLALKSKLCFCEIMKTRVCCQVLENRSKTVNLRSAPASASPELPHSNRYNQLQSLPSLSKKTKCVWRFIFDPGWQWSRCAKTIIQKRTCRRCAYLALCLRKKQTQQTGVRGEPSEQFVTSLKAAYASFKALLQDTFREHSASQIGSFSVPHCNYSTKKKHN